MITWRDTDQALHHSSATCQSLRLYTMLIALGAWHHSVLPRQGYSLPKWGNKLKSLCKKATGAYQGHTREWPLPCPRTLPACQIPTLHLPQFWATNICSLHQRRNQTAVKLTVVLRVISREHQDHNFMCKVKGSVRLCCPQSCRLHSLSKTTDRWEGSAWERWEALNKDVLESHLASTISLQGSISAFFFFLNTLGALYTFSLFVFNLWNGYSQSLQTSWGRG